MRRPFFVLPLLAAVLAGCELQGPVQCPPTVQTAESSAAPMSLVAPPALRVRVVDSASGASLAAGATGAFVTGSLADSLRHVGDELVAEGPAGRYAVVVQRPGYRLWALDDVKVRAGDCGMESVLLTAPLERGGLD